MYNPRAVMITGTTGGLLGGATVGVVEAVYLLASTQEGADYQPLAYAAIFYGLLGLVIGLSAVSSTQGVLRLLRKPFGPPRLMMLSYLSTLCVLGLATIVAVLRRDVYDYTGPPPLILMILMVTLLGVSAIIFVIGSGLLERTMAGVLVTPAGGFGLYLGTVVFLVLMHVGSGQLKPPVLAADSVPPDLARRPNVLIVVVDSLRTDHVGCYGSTLGLTPALDELAAEAVVYEQAIAQSPWTRASFASLLASLYPSSHGIQGPSDTLVEAIDTLPEVMQTGGYVTGSRLNSPDLTTRLGFHQGFDDFEYLAPLRPLGASEASSLLVLYAAIRFRLGGMVPTDRRSVTSYYQDAGTVTAEGQEFLLTQRRGRWMLTLHYMEPHQPYFRHPRDGHAVARRDGVSPDLETVREMETLYRGEVRHADANLGVLLEFLRAEGLYDDALIIVTSDHGEELGDHGGWWHGTTLYDEQIRVPLVVKYPRGYSYVARQVAAVDPEIDPTLELVEVGNGERVSDLVRTIDVAPTVTQLAGLGLPGGWQGVPLDGTYNLREPRDQVAFSEVDLGGNVAASLRTATHKLVEAEPGGPSGLPACALFHLTEDPRERLDLCLTEPHDPLRVQLATLRAYAHGQTDLADLAPAQACPRLRELGYLDEAVSCEP